MRMVVVYKSESDYARGVTDFLRDFTRQTGHTIDEIDPDTREGESFCRVYDIVQYPTLIAVDNDGVMQNMWVGMLPTISEASYYAA